ncbi:hypothetical protein WMW72_00890 [Paenibacillus filicis]|uniref:PH domain-containing protein n=1 Tax=Paenibacillus filicis TaxID=669464 RepID=A0ABU9DFD5_9BACL
MHQVIAEHPYYKIERSLTSSGQTSLVDHRILCLYATKITTRYREFPLDEVYDMSYRRMGPDEGMLYLHTRQGVYPFQVNADPAAFIGAFKRLTKSE